MRDLECEVAIIGAGTAGLAAERGARGKGVRTLLIDDRFAGTTCASVGCMPSKLLIAAANAAYNARKASVFGIEVAELNIDGRAVLNRLRKERNAFVAGTQKSIKELPPEIRIRSQARFLNKTTLALADGRKISAKAVVIATGARPSIPKPFQGLGDLVLTNETIFELPALPASVAVVGAGPVGLELAQALARLGVTIEVFEQGEHIAALRDSDVTNELRSALEAEFPIHTGVKLEVEAIDRSARMSWSGASSGEKLFEKVLIAAGRPPDLAYLNLVAAGLLVDERGIPKFDDTTLQCGDSPIFLAGDVNGERPVLHEASFEGFVAGRNAATFPRMHKSERNVALSIMFTDPPLAVIGAPPSEQHVVTGTASYRDQGRARIDASTAGVAHIYAERGSGRLTGAILFGPGMDHIAHLFAWAIERGETATKLLALSIYHPTLEEGLKPALREICKAVQAPELQYLDDAAPPGS